MLLMRVYFKCYMNKWDMNIMHKLWVHLFPYTLSVATCCYKMVYNFM